MARPCTSSTQLPLSVTTPSRQTGWPAAQCDDRTRDQAACHRNHFDRQGEFAEHVDLLGGIDDAYELVAGLGDDLLAGQCRAAALDQALVRIAFVGAVDIKRQRPGGVEVEHFDAVAAQTRACSVPNSTPRRRCGV